MRTNVPEKRGGGYTVQGMSESEKRLNQQKIQQLLDQFKNDYDDDALDDFTKQYQAKLAFN